MIDEAPDDSSISAVDQHVGVGYLLPLIRIANYSEADPARFRGAMDLILPGDKAKWEEFYKKTRS